MITYNYQKQYILKNRKPIRLWINESIKQMNKKVGNINFIFCDNDFIKKLNKEYLNHDFTTDIITFDYTKGNRLHGDIYISIDEIKINKKRFKVNLQDEIHRVMIHGILHLSGYKDKTEQQFKLMKKKEEYYLSLRPFINLNL